jgi:NAD-dependent deacetylase
MQFRCSRYCQGIPSIIDEAAIKESVDGVPRCPHCGALVRPNVTLFGEFLHSDPLRRAESAIASADLLLVIGTSGVVAPASELPQLAKSYGLKLVEINPQASEIMPLADLWLPAPAGEVLPRIGKRLLAKSPVPRAAR